MASISINVVLRNALGTPIHGLLDMVEYGLLVVTFLGAPWVLSKQAHVMVDLVTGALPAAVARVLARIMAGIGLVICLILLRYGFEAAAQSFSRGSMIRSALVIPEYWVLAVVPVSFALLSAEFLRQMIRGPVTGVRAAL